MRWLILTLALAFLLVEAFWIFSPQVGCKPVSGKLVAARSQIYQLSLVSNYYAEQHSNEYPDSLRYLITEKYLTEKEYQKLTSNIQIDYFPHHFTPSSRSVIFVGHIPGYVVYGFSSGPVEDRKLKN
jgi:hypothetical protein